MSNTEKEVTGYETLGYETLGWNIKSVQNIDSN